MTTGEELKLISQACAVMIPTLKEAVRLAPYTSFNEFNWSQNRPTKNLEGNKMKNAKQMTKNSTNF